MSRPRVGWTAGEVNNNMMAMNIWTLGVDGDDGSILGVLPRLSSQKHVHKGDYGLRRTHRIRRIALAEDVSRGAATV
jgi:hypothetical protein